MSKVTTSDIVLDFTTAQQPVNNQDLAIMPASLAKRLLRLMAIHLSTATLSSTVEEHVDVLRVCSTMEEVLTVSGNFIQERVLIENVKTENWDAYTVQTTGAPFDEPVAVYVKPSKASRMSEGPSIPYSVDENNMAH